MSLQVAQVIQIHLFGLLETKLLSGIPSGLLPQSGILSGLLPHTPHYSALLDMPSCIFLLCLVINNVKLAVGQDPQSSI